MMLFPRGSTLRTLPHLVAVVAVAAIPLLSTGCKPSGKIRWTPPEQRSKLSPEEEFREARMEMMDGKNAAAAKRLKTLSERGDVPQPMLNWVTLYAGLAQLQAGDHEASRPIFKKLAERASAAKDPAYEKLNKFFAGVGERMSDDKPVPTSVASEYDRFNFEAVALFLYALKSESIGEFEDAMEFYRQFTTSDPKGTEAFAGINVHLLFSRGIANGVVEYEDRVESARRLLSENENVSTDEKKRILEEAKKIREKIKQDTKLTASLDSKMKKIAGDVGEIVRMSEENAAEDAKAFGPAREKWDKLAGEFMFAEAGAALMEPELKSEQYRADQEKLKLRSDWLEGFKFYLIQEIAVVGYPEPIKLKNGETIEGGFSRIDNNGITPKKEGAMQVPWAEVKPESIYAMAQYLVMPDEAPDAAGFRKWHLGNYAGFIGKTEEARKLLQEAAKANPSYQPELEKALSYLPKS